MTDQTIQAPRRSSTWWFVVAGLLVALLLAGVGAYYASSEPDGLEKVAADQGLDANVRDSAVAGSALADYSVSGVEDERISVGLAGVVGVAITFAFAGGMFLLVRRKGSSPPPVGATTPTAAEG